MKYLKENYRDFDFNLLVFMADVEVKTESKEKEKKVSENAPVKDKTPQEIWEADIEPKYNVDKFEAKIRKSVKEIYAGIIKASADKSMPKSAKIIDKEDLIQRSIDRYSYAYNKTLRDFIVKGTELHSNKEVAIAKVKAKTRKELAALKDAITKGGKAIHKKAEVMKSSKDFKNWLDKQNNVLEYPQSDEVIRRFGEYIEAMNTHYLNMRMSKGKLMKRVENSRTWGIPIIFPLLKKKVKYEEYFATRMFQKYDARIAYMLSIKTTDKDALKDVLQEIEEEYMRYANLDKKPGMIDAKDFGQLEKLASPQLNILAKMNTSSKSSDEEMLKAMQLVNPEAWNDSIERTRDIIINDAISNGSEGLFVEAANKWRVEQEGKGASIKTFSDAEDYFSDTLSIYTEMGVDRTYDFIMHFNAVVNAGRVEILNGIEPKIIKNLAYQERERLLARRMVPDRKGDKLIVEFVSANREGRERILQNSAAELLKEIENVKKHYPTAASAYKLKTNLKDGQLPPSAAHDKSQLPTAYDKVARLQAMVAIAKEAKWIVTNFSTMGDYKHLKLANLLENTKADNEPITTGWKLWDRRQFRGQPYRSALSRGGFNGRDLGMAGLKIIGVMTVLANVANSIQAADGTDFFEKMTDAVGKIATNPGVLAGVAVTVGAHTVQMNPEYYEYITESKYGRLSISTTRKLRSLSRRAGRSNLQKFVKNDSEWDVMKLKSMTPAKIKALVQDASKRKPPNIIKKDLSFVQNKDIMLGIPGDFNNAHLRFQFYKRFITGKDKPNVSELQSLCQDSSILN